MRGSQRLNYRAKVLMSLQDVSEALPDYTISEILYSALREHAKKIGSSISWLLETSDEDLSVMIESVMIKEKE